MKSEKKSEYKNAIKTAVASATPDMSPEDRKKYESVIADVVEKGMTPAAAMGFGEVELESFYGMGFNMYNSGKFKEAKNVFSALCNFDNTKGKHWYGLAACHHKLKEFEEAQIYYMSWSVLEPDNPIPYFHAADCSIHLNKQEEAIVFLTMAINRCKDIPEYQKIKEKAKSMQEKLREEVGKGKE